MPHNQPIAAIVVEDRSPRGAAIIDELAGGGQMATSKVNLAPGGQFIAYRLTEPIKVASGEADLCGRRVPSGLRVVLDGRHYDSLGSSD